MTAFLFRRILLAIPTLFIVLVICFFLSKIMPGDEVDIFNGNNTEGYSNRNSDPQLYEENYKKTVLQLGLNKPVFYWSLIYKSYPDTLERILFLPQKRLVVQYLQTSGNWPLIQNYFNSIDEILNHIRTLPDSSLAEKKSILSRVFSLKINQKDKDLENLSELFEKRITLHPLKKNIEGLINIKKEINSGSKNITAFYPKFKWNGVNNQFQLWMCSIFTGKYNISLIDGRPGWKKVSEALKWTITISAISLILSIFISILLGKYLAEKQNSGLEKFLSGFLFSIYTLPVFLVGSLLLIFFTNNEFGKWMNLFPSDGIGDVNSSDTIIEIVIQRAYHFILPVICLSYSSIAYLSFHIRDGILDGFKEAWYTTAISKGLSRREAIKTHSLKNALFPLISLLGQIIPSVISGSMIVEVLFSIPGMGRLMYSSILSHDWPVVFDTIVISAIVVILAQLVVDILYRVLDPRVSVKE